MLCLVLFSGKPMKNDRDMDNNAEMVFRYTIFTLLYNKT